MWKCRQTKRPLLFCGGFFCIGIFWAKEENVVILILVAMMLLVIARYKKSVFSLLCILSLFTGALRLLQTQQLRRPAELLRDSQNITVVGNLYKIEVKHQKEYLYLKNVRVINETASRQINSIQIISNSHVSSHIGNLIQVKGTFKQWNIAKNPGAFDEAMYYHTLKIDGKVILKSYRIILDTKDVLGEWLSNMRTQISFTYEKLCSPKDAAILCAMILGDKTKLEEDIKSIYQDAGVMHILAISGLHISIIGMVCFRLFRRLGLGFLASGLICIVIISSYGIFTGFSISTIRAVLMFLLFIGAQILGRTYDLFSAAALASIGMLYENPLLLNQGAFLLSYGAILVIALVNEIQHKEKQEVKNENMNDKIENKDNKSTKIKKEIIVYIKAGLWSSFCIQLGTLPIVAYFYYETARYAVFVNLVVLFLLPWIIQLGVVGGIVGGYWPIVGKYILKVCSMIIWLNESTCKFFQKLPLEHWIVGKPAVWKIVVYYLVFGFFFWVRYHLKSKLLKRGGSIILCIVMLTILSFRFYSGIEITSLFVGQGDGTFIRGPRGRNYFIDGGSSDLKEVGTRQILPFLKSKGIKTIHYWFVTHTDTDHISGLREILIEGYPIEYLFLPRIKVRNEAYEELIKLGKKAGTKVFAIEKGDIFEEKVKDEKMVIRCLYPSYDKLISAESCNSTSVVLSLEYQGINGLFTGDLESDGEEILQKENNLLDYHILKVAHHGSKNSTSKKFLEIIKPELSIISCGENNSYGHPHEELIDRLNSSKSRIHITSEEGAISIGISNKSGKRVKISVFKR